MSALVYNDVGLKETTLWKQKIVAFVATLAIGSITYTSINKTRVFMHSSFLFIIDTQYGDF